MTNAPNASKPRQQKPLEPVTPAVELVEYDMETGVGILAIDGNRYVMVRFRDGQKTVGMRLTRHDDKKGLRLIDIDFTAPNGWQCDCEDATYRSERPGGCKHVVALRKVAAGMRCQKPAAAK